MRTVLRITSTAAIMLIRATTNMMSARVRYCRSCSPKASLSKTTSLTPG